MWYVKAEQDAARRDEENACQVSRLSPAAGLSGASSSIHALHAAHQSETPKWRPRYLAQRMKETEGRQDEDGAPRAVVSSSVRLGDEVTEPYKPSLQNGGVAYMSHGSLPDAAMTAESSGEDSSSRSRDHSEEEEERGKGDKARARSTDSEDDNADARLLIGRPTTHTTAGGTSTATDDAADLRSPSLSWRLVPRAHGVNEALLCLLDASDLVVEENTLGEEEEGQAHGEDEDDASHTLLATSSRDLPTHASASCSRHSPSSTLSRTASGIISSVPTSAAQRVLSNALANNSSRSVRHTRRVTQRKVRLLVRALTRLLGAAVRQPVALKLHPNSAGGTYMVQTRMQEEAEEQEEPRASIATAPPTPALHAAGRRSQPEESASTSSSAVVNTAAGRQRRKRVPPMTTIAVFKPREEEIGQSLNPHGNRVSDRDAVFRPGTGSRREMLAYCLDHEHLAGVPPTLEVVAQTVTPPPSRYSQSSSVSSGGSHAASVDPASDSTNNNNNSKNNTSAMPTPLTERVGSLQSFIPDCVESADVLPGEFSVEEVQAIAIFDIRVLNGDRHGGNILVTPHRPTARPFTRRRQGRGRDSGRRHHPCSQRHAQAQTPNQEESTHDEKTERRPLARSSSSASSCASSSSSSTSLTSTPSSRSTHISSSSECDEDDCETEAVTVAPHRSQRHRPSNGHHAHHGRRRGRRAPYAARTRKHLVPIDHSYICPSGYADPDYEWLAWPQSKQPFTPRLLEYIAHLDAETDAELVRAALLPRSAVQQFSTTMSISHSALSVTPRSTLAPYPSGFGYGENSLSASADPPASAVPLPLQPGHSHVTPLLTSPPPLPPSRMTAAAARHLHKENSLSLSSCDSSLLGEDGVALEEHAGETGSTRFFSGGGGGAPGTSPWNARSALTQKLKEKRAGSAMVQDGTVSVSSTRRARSDSRGGSRHGFCLETNGMPVAEVAEPRPFPSPASASAAANVAAVDSKPLTRLHTDTGEGEDTDTLRCADLIQWDVEQSEGESSLHHLGSSESFDGSAAAAEAEAEDSVLTLSLPDGVTGAYAAFHRTFSTWHDDPPHQSTPAEPRGVHSSWHVRGTAAGSRAGPASAAVTPRRYLGDALESEKNRTDLPVLRAWPTHALLSRQKAAAPLDDHHHGHGHGYGSMPLRRAQSAAILSFSPSSPLAAEDGERRQTGFADGLTSPILTHPGMGAASSMASSLTNRREVSFANLSNGGAASPHSPLQPTSAAHRLAISRTPAPRSALAESLVCSPTCLPVRGSASVPEMASLYSADLSVDTEAADAAADVILCTTHLLKIAALEFGMTARAIGELCRRPRITAASFLEEAMEAAREELSWRLDLDTFQAIVRERLAGEEEGECAS